MMLLNLPNNSSMRIPACRYFCFPQAGEDWDQTDEGMVLRLQVFIRVIFALLPFLCSSISLCIKSTFPIRTKEMLDQIHEGIALHQR